MVDIAKVKAFGIGRERLEARGMSVLIDRLKCT